MQTQQLMNANMHTIGKKAENLSTVILFVKENFDFQHGLLLVSRTGLETNFIHFCDHYWAANIITLSITQDFENQTKSTAQFKFLE